MISDPLVKIIKRKLEMDLSEMVVYPYGADIWVFDYDNKTWVFRYENDGKLSYNLRFFNNFFRLFSLEHKEYQKILKAWFIKHFEIHVLSIHRVNTNLEYILDGILNSKKYEWTLKKRFGYSYSVVKKFLSLRPKKQKFVYLKEYFELPIDSNP